MRSVADGDDDDERNVNLKTRALNIRVVTCGESAIIEEERCRGRKVVNRGELSEFLNE